ncbi:MAG: hypothetical protein RLZZ220_1737, partial [Pseudomonadota bacterium]
MIPPDADLDSQDAQIGRAVRAFLASGEAEGVLDTPLGEVVTAEQCVAALGVLLGARDAAERGLHEMRERLDLAMHNTEGGVWDWDLARNSIVIDSAWRKTLGYDESEYSSSGLAWVPLVHPHDLELMRNQ